MNDEKPGAMTGTISAHSSAGATIDARFEGTGRQITADNDYQQVSNWSQCVSEDDWREHAAHDRFVEAVSKASRVEINVSCFRGRRISSGTPTWQDMGPPPVECGPAAGRYNVEGRAVLYLSDGCDGVTRELRNATEGVWVQRFTIPCERLKVANFGIDSVDDFVNIVLWWAENVGLDDSPSGSLFSRLVSDLVALTYDGMRVPGVRGADAKYHNLVMFRPHSIWQSWVEQATRPALLEDCIAVRSAVAPARKS